LLIVLEIEMRKIILSDLYGQLADSVHGWAAGWKKLAPLPAARQPA
jgi:hypothetical protein